MINDSIFTYKDESEGKIGIGKLPIDLLPVLKELSNDYYDLIPDKKSSTFHTWYKELNPSLKSKVAKIQNHKFFHELCDGSNKCININVHEMDELYYSNPKNNLNKINLYGASSNYDIHKDCIFNFNGIKFYRVLIGLTNRNDNIITHFKNLDKGHKINFGDYIVFDFDKSTHQVIKDKEKSTPRILLKIHYIVCENCKYSKEYVECVKNFYQKYEMITRYIMKTGTDPTTFYQFFMGLVCQFFYTNNIKYVILLLIIFIIFVLEYFLKIKLIYENTSKIITNVLFWLIFIFLIIVTFYWLRYKLFRIR
jgi:hypothetical protein